MYKAGNRSVQSDEDASKKGSGVSENTTSATSLSPRKKTGASAAKDNRASSSSGMRAIVGFEHYRSTMETVEAIQQSTSGIPREKYIETLMGCVDAQHAAKTDPKLLSRFSQLFSPRYCAHLILQVLGSIRGAGAQIRGVSARAGQQLGLFDSSAFIWSREQLCH